MSEVKKPSSFDPLPQEQPTKKARKPRGPNKAKTVKKPKREPVYKEGVHAAIAVSPENRMNIKYCGEYVKVKLHNEVYNPKGGMFEFGLGDFPKFYVAPNVECIMPIEIFNVLQNTTVEVIDCDMDNARQGQRVEYGTRINVRIPYQFLGQSNEAEYKAQMREQALRPPYKPLK